jgi:hypothetical protein
MPKYLCEKLLNNLHTAYVLSVERSLLQSTKTELRDISKFQLNIFISWCKILMLDGNRAVELVHKTSNFDSNYDSSIFKSLTPTPS